mmetsp:Transcript_27945/g.64923  ORF Transcript_27945/g.64923 Transcript_27945/m.64923 type:complete len:223 (-) Transcript_27945:338-1006(-)
MAWRSKFGGEAEEVVSWAVAPPDSAGGLTLDDDETVGSSPDPASPSLSSAASARPFFFFLLALGFFSALEAPFMNFAISSMLGSGQSVRPFPSKDAADGPRTSTKLITHSKAGASALFSPAQSRWLASQMTLSNCMGIHQRVRTSLEPLCAMSSMVSVRRSRAHLPRSIRMNSRCFVSGLVRTGPAVIFSAGCSAASFTRDSNSNSMYSPSHWMGSLFGPRT